MFNSPALFNSFQQCKRFSIFLIMNSLTNQLQPAAVFFCWCLKEDLVPEKNTGWLARHARVVVQ